jgi:hypothetical protein
MDYSEVDNFLEHYGVKGMQWGRRRSRSERQGAKDAKEFVDAKLFYGQGAGTRRKLIKARVESNKKRLGTEYADAFDAAVSGRDVGKARDKAVRTRKVKDAKTKNKQRAGAVARRVTGQMGTQAAFTGLALTGAAYAKSPQGQARMKSTVNKVKNSAATKQGARKLKKFLNQ